MAERGSLPLGLLRGLWRLLTAVAGLAFLAAVVVLILILVPAARPAVPAKAALVIGPNGRLVEELTGEPVQRAVARALGRERPETLLKDVLDGIHSARDDRRIQALYLDLDRFDGAGLSKLQAVAGAIREFRAAGKPVIAAAQVMDQDRYYLAAQAGEVYMPADGLLLIEGYGAYRLYFKDGLDRLGVDVHVYRQGIYKSAPEDLMLEGMSEAAREENRAWLGDLWQAWLADVAKARGLTVRALGDSVADADRLMAAAGGQVTRAAQDAGLIDHIAPDDVVRQRLVDLVGEDEDEHTFNQVGLDAYLRARGGDRFGQHARGDLVGVVVARGDIVGGDQPPGTIGGDSTGRLIRRARHDHRVKALVLRVDSPGGVMFAADRIQRELELTRKAGKPVVVSMSSVAASGGYEISVAADRILCSPTTLTGSIGVFTILPTFEKPLERYLGAELDGVGTTPWAGTLRLDRALDPRLGAAVEAYNTWAYNQFVGIVAEGRGMTPEAVDEVAQGRVWSGEEALKIGLVDRFGELEDAVAGAAELAQLGTRYRVTYIRPETTFGERMLIRLLGVAGRLVPAAVGGALAPFELAPGLRDAAWLSRLASQPPQPYEYAFLPVD